MDASESMVDGYEIQTRYLYWQTKKFCLEWMRQKPTTRTWFVIAHGITHLA